MFEIDSLKAKTNKGQILLEQVSIKLNKGEIIGITGQSGAGKTTLIKSILKMNPKNINIKGSAYLDECSLFETKENYCGIKIGFVPQLPMTAFDNRLKIGNQLIETYKYKLGLSKKQSKELAIKTLKLVNLVDTKRIMNSKPNELSGGMLQRVAFSYLLGLKPKYVLADEPTAALDESNRDLIIKLLKRISKNSGIILVSHDTKALEELSNKIVVLNKGKSEYYSCFENLIKTPIGKWSKEFAIQYNINKKLEEKWKHLKL